LGPEGPLKYEEERKRKEKEKERKKIGREL
jgi:hypothetical protein